MRAQFNFGGTVYGGFVFKARRLQGSSMSVGLGAVLVQKSDGLQNVIAYASRSLSTAEANYSTTERECLAIIWATSKFRPYLYGRPFKVVSDHHALCWLANLKDPSGRLARWSLRLQEFDVTVVYKSGLKHSDADCLSRAPVDAPPPDDDEDAFLGPISSSSFAQQQSSDPHLKCLIEYLEGNVSSPPASFKRGLSSFCVQNDVLMKNFAANKTAYLLVTWDVILPFVVFAYNTAVQETTQMTPFRLVHGREATTTLDAMLPNVTEEENVDVAAYLQRAEEARRLARLRIKDQQRTDTRRYNLRRRNAEYKPGDQVWVWTPIRRRGLSEKLLSRYFGPDKVLRRLGELDYEVIPDAMTASQRRRVRPEVVHVVRLKPYYTR
ncbi:uncharacterized protein [Dermacentor andersoni]|uniref:uncharacterized protein n=1 Tax=Dermacentor andersoni TaxID=34620 RepID=UPI003B3AB204